MDSFSWVEFEAFVQELTHLITIFSNLKLTVVTYHYTVGQLRAGHSV